MSSSCIHFNVTVSVTILCLQIAEEEYAVNTGNKFYAYSIMHIDNKLIIYCKDNTRNVGIVLSV